MAPTSALKPVEGLCLEGFALTSCHKVTVTWTEGLQIGPPYNENIQNICSSSKELRTLSISKH